MSEHVGSAAVAPSAADLTIAICTIGRDGYLQVAIQSLLDTTPAGVRLHVVLNAPDNPELQHSLHDLLSQWRGPVTTTVLDERLTISGSHNTALNLVTTDFVTFMGDDDLALEPRVEQLLEIFSTTTPTPAVVGSFCRRVSGTYDQPKFSTNKDYGPTNIAEWEAARDSGELIEIVFPSAIYQTELLRSIGGFEERFGSAMDLATFTALAQDHPVIADPRRTFAHRIHDGSVTSSSASQHAARLRYTEACVRAIREGSEQPGWDHFLAEESAARQTTRLSDNRHTMSATLFRQGGAAFASGSPLPGIAKIAGSALVSPITFAGRLRSQVTRETNAEPVVSIMLKNANHYRTPFYEALREELRGRHVELRMVVASGLKEDQAKGDQASLSWAEYRPFRQIDIAGRTLLWQPGFDIASTSELIITEQASKQLFNTVLAYGQRVMRTRHCFWGHGKNFQSSIEGESGEGLKQRLTEKAHWFFAYNDLSAAAAAAAGMPEDRITPVMNTTDTEHIAAYLNALPHDHDEAVRAEFGIGSGPVVLFMGGIYPPKRPEFLLQSILDLHELLPDAHALVIGSGSDAHLISEAAEKYDFIHATGSLYGDERLRVASIAALQIMPGMVGLNIVDAFGLGIPTITTDISYHSPEIDYLEDGINGVVVHGDPSPREFAAEVSNVLSDPERLAALQLAASKTGSELTISNMVTRFADGVMAALDAPSR